VTNSAAYGGYGGYGPTLTRDQTRTLFSQTMGYVALTAGLFALGAYAGRGLSYGLGWIWFIAAFVCLIAMYFAVRRSLQLTVALLCGFGVLIGLAMALFIAGFGAAGYATRRDLAPIARIAFFGLIGLIIFGIVLIFVRIPHADLIYSIIGLAIFAVFTMFDFQRLRTSKDIRSAPLLAASIFLDVLNVFLFFLRIFSRSN
jgi:modulator of FtsH protease